MYGLNYQSTQRADSTKPIFWLILDSESKFGLVTDQVSGIEDQLCWPVSVGDRLALGNNIKNFEYC